MLFSLTPSGQLSFTQEWQGRRSEIILKFALRSRPQNRDTMYSFDFTPTVILTLHSF